MVRVDNKLTRLAGPSLVFISDSGHDLKWTAPHVFSSNLEPLGTGEKKVGFNQGQSFATQKSQRNKGMREFRCGQMNGQNDGLGNWSQVMRERKWWLKKWRGQLISRLIIIFNILSCDILECAHWFKCRFRFQVHISSKSLRVYLELSFPQEISFLKALLLRIFTYVPLPPLPLTSSSPPCTLQEISFLKKIKV